MRQNEQVWWASATVISLGAFSFFAGFGLRGLFDGVRGSRGGDAINGYPKLASAAPKGSGPNLSPQTLYWDVLKKLQLYYVEPLPTHDALALGSIDAMLNELQDPNTRLLSKVEVDAMQSATRGEFRGLGAVLTIMRQSTEKGEEVVMDAPSGRLPGVKRVPAGLPPSKPAAEDEKPGPTGVRTITVVSVLPGSPAEKAGMQAGDRITHIDGRWIAPTHVSYRLLTQLTESLGPQDLRPRDPNDTDSLDVPPPNPERDRARKEADEARSRWKNAAELPVAIQTLSGGQTGDHELIIERGRPTKTLKVNVTLGSTKADVVSAKKVSDKVGHLRILAFNPDVPQEVATALQDFQKSGIKSLVVDLRENAGGSIDAARAVAGMLLGNAKFAVVRERDAARKIVERTVLTEAGSVHFTPASLSVLVDRGTAGTAELLAAALRDQTNVKLVGANTFGDGTEQELLVLDNGTGFTLTRAQFQTLKGVAFDRRGLKVDVPVEGDALQAAVNALTAPTAVRSAAAEPAALPKKDSK
jgi:carboxyl-terminal processing protease